MRGVWPETSLVGHILPGLTTRRRPLLRAGAAALPALAAAAPRVAGGATTPAPSGRAAGQAVLNVRDFGAVGDGVADDTAAINAALAAAVQAGAGTTLVIPAGRYALGTAAVAQGLVLCQGDGAA